MFRTFLFALLAGVLLGCAPDAEDVAKMDPPLYIPPRAEAGGVALVEARRSIGVLGGTTLLMIDDMRVMSKDGFVAKPVQDQLAAGYVTRTMSDGREAEFIAVAPGYHSLGYWFLPGMRRSDINIFNPGPTIIPVMVDAQLQPGRLYRAEVEYDGASRNLRLWLRDLRTGEVVGSMHIT